MQIILNEEMLDSYGVIYKITNIINNKCYIGQSIDVKERSYKYHNWRRHCINLPKLYNAFNKHGSDNFKFELIDKALNREQLDLLEDRYILKFDALDNGYNCRRGGANGKPSKETLQKLSKSHLGQLAWNKGIPVPEEIKKRISESLKRRYEKGMVHPMKGDHHSEKTKKILSEKNRKYRHTPEAIEKIRQTSTGRKHTLETKRLMSNIWLEKRNHNCGI